MLRAARAGSDPVPGHALSLAIPPVTPTYANAYGRFSVQDKLCELSYSGHRPGRDTSPLPPAARPGVRHGQRDTADRGIQIINNVSVGGARLTRGRSRRPPGWQDYNVDGAMCQRGLFTGTDAPRDRERAACSRAAHGNLQWQAGDHRRRARRHA